MCVIYFCEYLFTANRCPPVPVLHTALSNTTLATEGTVVAYTCTSGYSSPLRDKLQTIICHDGVWQDVNTLLECIGMSQYIPMSEL